MYICNPPHNIASSLGVVIFKDCLVYIILHYDNHPRFCLYRDKLKKVVSDPTWEIVHPQSDIL